MTNPGWDKNERIRTYGASGPWVIALHGGPAASGSAAPLARGLADAFRVLEPWQRGSGDEPLTVARHVADLDNLIRSRCADTRPALVGESWGAMLALAYAAEHPDSAGPLVLVGCGTFDTTARARMTEVLDERKDDALRQRIEQLTEKIADPEQRQGEIYKLTAHLYSYDPLPADDEETPEPFDMRAHKETWEDMVRLQKAGVYPAAFAAIRSPVVMLHGAYDPHPGTMIRESLAPHIPQLEYREWERCGHYPWHERGVRDEFFAVMHQWLTNRLAQGA
jgi:pimeloyl-ACP methyl ester carboxylesterase